MANDIDYWIEGVILVIFENIKPEWSQTGAQAIEMKDQIDLIVAKKPEKRWDDLTFTQRTDLVRSTFKALSRQRTMYVGEECKMIPKKLVRIGKRLGESVYRPANAKVSVKKVGIVIPSRATEMRIEDL